MRGSKKCKVLEWVQDKYPNVNLNNKKNLFIMVSWFSQKGEKEKQIPKVLFEENNNYLTRMFWIYLKCQQ